MFCKRMFRCVCLCVSRSVYAYIHIVLADSSGLNLYIVHALVFVCLKVCMLSTVTLSFTVSYFMSDYVPSQSCTHVVVFLNVHWSECMLLNTVAYIIYDCVRNDACHHISLSHLCMCVQEKGEQLLC